MSVVVKRCALPQTPDLADAAVMLPTLVDFSVSLSL